MIRSHPSADGAEVPETAIRDQSQSADMLLRPDPDAEEPLPACPEGEFRGDADLADVSIAAYPHYKLCENSECFGREWR